MILEVNDKSEIIAKEIIINFHAKMIAIGNVRLKILAEIHKFPFSVQKLLAEEVHAVSKRLKEEKKVLGLLNAQCSCKFFN